jgi:hypothetical protein
VAKQVVLNDGAQRDFVTSSARASAYIGGVGSGKTFAGIVKGLAKSQLPTAPGQSSGPRGAIGASTYGVLKKVIVPQFFEVMDGSDLWKTGRRATSWVKSEMMARLVSNCGCKNRHTCEHESQIYLVSLDDPDEIRGMELTWFYIDEGRNTTRYAWTVLWGRLRQQGYAAHQAGWVCSTSNGFDWLYDCFHDDSTSEFRIDDAELHIAATMDNPHLNPEYIEGLRAQYHGRFFEQEVLGRFVGMTEGAVFFEWDPKDSGERVLHDPKLPLYSAWDFGMGDLNVVVFFQIAWDDRREVGAKTTFRVPTLHFIGALEAKERTSGEWAKVFHAYCDERYGRQPSVNVGDPAGRQRNQVTGTSVITDLSIHGVRIAPAPKKPTDYAVRILNNMMADRRMLVDREECGRLAQALSSYKWQLNTLGSKTSNTPVHDWPSHYCDAVRYGVTVLVPETPTRVEEAPPQEYERDQWGFVFSQVLKEASPEGWLGPQPKPAIDWVPGIIRPRKEQP